MWSIIKKDLRIERRTGEMVSSLLLLALLIVMMFAFAMDPERLAGPQFAAGLMWTTLLFSGTLSLNRSFFTEREAGAWTALALAPLDRGSIYLGKMIANVIFLSVAALTLLPVIVIMLGTSDLAPTPLLLGSILLGVLGMSAVGTLFAAMASRTRAREILLPLLSFPIMAPLLMGAVRTTAAGLAAEPVDQIESWLLMLAGYDIVFVTSGWLTFDQIIED